MLVEPEMPRLTGIDELALIPAATAVETDSINKMPTALFIRFTAPDKTGKEYILLASSPCKNPGCI
jgi:hypothetical protein